MTDVLENLENIDTDMIAYLRKAKIDWVLFFFIVSSLNLFEFTGFQLEAYQYVHLLVFAWILYVTFFKHGIRYGGSHYKSVLLMTFLPLLSIYSCYAINGQSYSTSLVIFRMHLGWLVYFYLSYKKVPLPSILKTILVVGCIYMALSLIQQVTYPFAPFGKRTVGTEYAENKALGVERRMGFYRFSVGGLSYCILSLFIVLANNVRHRKGLLLLLSLGIVASGNRQTMFSVFVAAVYYYLFSKDVKYKFLIMAVIFVACIFVYTFADAIFGRLVNVGDDLESGRMPSYIFYYDLIVQSPLALLLGNGLPGNSAYGMRQDIYEGFRVTPSDIGLVGTTYYWGALYVGAYLFFMLRWLFHKRLSATYKAMVLSFLVCSPIASYLFEIEGFILHGILFYLCDLDVHNACSVRRQVATGYYAESQRVSKKSHFAL